MVAEGIDSGGQAPPLQHAPLDWRCVCHEEIEFY